MRRFVDGEPMDLHDLRQIVRDNWRNDDVAAPAFVDDLLSEPPRASGVIAPFLLLLVLREIRKILLAREGLPAHERELLHWAHERSALCLLADDTVPRRSRFLAALEVLLARDGPGDPLERAVPLRWLAELAYRLTTEFGDPGYADIGANAFRLLQSRGNDLPQGLLDLHRSYELRLLGLRARMPTRDDVTSSPEWQDIEASARDAMAQLDRQFSLDGHWSAAARSAVLSVLAGQGEGADTWTQVVLSRIEATPAAVSRERRDEMRATLKQMYASMVALCRTRAAVGQPIPTSMRATLRRLLGAIAPQGATDLAIELHVDELLARDSGRRFGLALSGGGFRAALFHLGVLARLAETDALRQLDVLSCVSGGSIVGACYAVRLRSLLLDKCDLEITRDDYIKVVEDVIAVFLDVMGKNLRMRALADPRAILRMWFKRDYTFAERIAELMDSMLLAPLHGAVATMNPRELRRLGRLPGQMTRPGALGKARAILEPVIGWPIAAWDLCFAPVGEDSDFSVTSPANRLRRSRLPQFVFNATTVNTGYGFTFSGQSHGEPADPAAIAISRRPRLAELPYDDIVTGSTWDPARLSLSRVVAASACVPGVIPPIALRRDNRNVSDEQSDRDEQGFLLALSDGGMFDNQGVDALFRGLCSDLLVSDAAGQLPYQPYPDVTNFTLMSRATDILMERVRELSFGRIAEAQSGRQRTRCAHLHLTRELRTPGPRSDFRPDDVLRELYENTLERSKPTTYGLHRRAQGLLAELRTDLDCFCEVETDALMLSGYLQAQTFFDPQEAGLAVSTAEAHPWPFRASQRLFAMDFRIEGRPGIVLAAGSRRWGRLFAIASGFFRSTRLGSVLAARMPWLKRVAGWVLLVSIAGLLGYEVLHRPLLNIVVWLALGAAAFALIARPTKHKRRLVKLALGPLLVVAMLIAWFVLLVCDPVYRRLGRLPVSGSG